METTASALTFLHRYFSVRSLLASDCYIIGAACLLLATKSEDQTRAVQDIIKYSWRSRHAQLAFCQLAPRSGSCAPCKAGCCKLLVTSEVYQVSEEAGSRERVGGR